MLESAGIDKSVFNAHSVRGASSTVAANLGITTNDILADWSSESVFQVYKPTEDLSFVVERCFQAGTLCIRVHVGHCDGVYQ